ncbi:hypothetical protein MLD52_21375, partial [Puniceicoccaceae bacterium K14]|nr:hypothetical protein [Puniceicoccaceae bacterium K14]
VNAGEYEIGLDPTSGDIDFNAGVADLGSFAFYQDSNSGGSLIIDNLLFAEVGYEASDVVDVDPEINIYSSLDFEDDTLGEAPVVAGAGYTPGSNDATNGTVIIDSTSTPVANPFEGQSMYVYDLGVASGNSTHFRYPFNGGTDVSNVRVDFDFQRGYEVVAPEGDTGIHVAVGRASAGSLNNSDFRPFRVSIFNDGTFSIDDISGTTALGTYATTGAEHMTWLVNSHDTQSVSYDLDDLGTGSVMPNSVHVFLNDILLGEFDFFITPDPTNAPQIIFNQENNDLGQIGFFQDTNSEGGIVFDNVVVKRINDIVAAPSAPSGVTQDSVGSQVATISWTDNASDETGFIIERKEGSDGTFTEVGTTGPDEVAFSDSGLDPETTYFYRVIATNGLDSDPSDELEVTTSEQIEPLITGSESVSLAVPNTSALLEVTAIGQDPLTYQWYLGERGDVSNPVAGATEASFDAPVEEANISYWVRVTNNSGTFDSDTFAIEVSIPESTLVSTESELETAIAAALPGDEIVIANGEYEDWVIEFEGMGLEGVPITLRAETAGEVIFKLASRLEIGGEWLVVDGLVFTGEYTGNDDEVVQFRSSTQAQNCRMTNVSIIDYIPSENVRTVYVALYGANNRVDHCYFTGHDVIGVTMIVWLDGVPDYHLIDNNHFANRIDGQVNGWETIRIGTSTNSMTDSFTTVEHNLFERLDGEIEIISNKSGNNVYRYNTFLNCRGTLTLRHGDNCLVEGNYFLGGFLDETGGVRVIGRDHVVINNYFSETTARDDAAITVYAGVDNGPLNGYFSADRTLVAFNTFYDNEGPLIEIGAGFGSSDRTVLPTDIVVVNNVMDAGDETAGTFVFGENPEAQTWAGNIINGRSMGGGLTSGFVETDPLLELDGVSGILRPATNSPVIDASSDIFDDVDIDIDGQNREGIPDVGADEVSSAAGLVFGPTSAFDTGPSYLGPNRVLGEMSILVNQSIRAEVTPDEGTMIAGFVIDGTESKTMLVRAVGPGLLSQGVESPVGDPILLVYDADGVEIYRNDDWWDYSADELNAITIASSSVGAFDLGETSSDSVILEDFAPGIYTAHVVSADGIAGEALLEMYDVSGDNSLVNQSARANICEEVDTCITGFSIADGAGQTLLIRGVGPALADYEVDDFVTDVNIEIFDSDGNSIASNDDWSGSDVSDAATAVGAFDLIEGSKDSAILISLEAGEYTVHATNPNDGVGVVLVEAYVVE